MLRWLYRWLDRLFAVAGAFLFSQFPQFYEQYLQRAMGHLSELQHQIQLMSQAAGLTGKTLEDYIKKFMSSEDLDIAHQGALMQQMSDRATELSQGIVALTQADLFMRPFTFLANVHTDIAQTTLTHFIPGFSFNFEGIVWALLGVFFGYGVFHLVTAILSAPFRSRA